jgi:hypothetical protein
MAGRSVVSDYTSIILRAIEEAQNDPARLRQLIYDIARTSLGKQVLIRYSEIGSEGLQQQISSLETAIRRVEILARLESELIPHDSEVPLIEGPVSLLDHDSVIVSDPLDDSSGGKSRHSNEIIVAATTPPSVYREDATASELLTTSHLSTHAWEATVVAAPERSPSKRFRRFELPVALLIALVINALIFVKSDYLRSFGLLPSRLFAHGAATRVTPAASNTGPASLAGTTGNQKLDFPLPSIYGVYAESEGKLYALEPLAMRVPDPRVAISAMISSPSQVTIPSGKIAFIVYRRDLAASAPDSASVRIIARVMRELKFSEAGPPKTIDVKGEWAIRSKSYQFGVAPLKNSQEMIMLSPLDPQLVLPAGRYALVIKGGGYDFSVAGPMTDLAQCLERTNALGGMVYSECPSVQ